MGVDDLKLLTLGWIEKDAIMVSGSLHHSAIVSHSDPGSTNRLMSISIVEQFHDTRNQVLAAEEVEPR